MAGGGRREGAGRPPGSRNRATTARQAEIAASGLTPLDYMLTILRDERQSPEARLEAAKASAPYVHPRLGAIEHTGHLAINHDISDEPLSDEEWAARHVTDH